MHEVSIVLGMVEELMKLARKHHAIKITSIKLKIGKMSGIVTDSIVFAFDAIKPEHPLLSTASIIIEEVPAVYECNECKTSFNTDDIYFPSCPGCKSFNLNIVSGDEQHIENVEIETEDP